MREDSEYIIPLMCKKGFLELDPADVREIVMGSYAFISVKGEGGCRKRFRDALRKLPWIPYSKALILVEYHPTREPLFSEIDMITSRFPPFNCSIGFSELPLSSGPDIVVVRLLLLVQT
jgi:hypothetical protein